jgi:Ulp1 family protease
MYIYNLTCLQMYIPMNDQGRHWYLMVVDFTERKLVWLDSLHSDERDPFRRRAILFMVCIQVHHYM